MDEINTTSQYTFFPRYDEDPTYIDISQDTYIRNSINISEIIKDEVRNQLIKAYRSWSELIDESKGIIDEDSFENFINNL